MKKKNSLIKRIDEEFAWDKRTVGVFFLGVGVIMFIINITSILTILQYTTLVNPLGAYYTSVISSLVLITYSLYNIYTE